MELNTENQFQPHALLSKKDVKSIFCEIDEIRQEDTTIGEEPHDNTQYVDGVLKKELENIARIYSVEEGKTITFLDLMRRGIQEKYQLGEQNDEQETLS